MSFKLYEDKSSVRKKFSRYTQGGRSEVLEKTVGWWEKIDLAENDVTDTFFTITKTYEKSPGLVAADFYGRSDLMWLVLQYNNVVDINEEFVTGKEIRLPSRDRVFYEILTKPIASKRVTRSNVNT